MAERSVNPVRSNKPCPLGCPGVFPIFVQLCPALMDWAVFLMVFAVLFGAGQRGFTSLQCAWIGGIGQLAYMAMSLAVGLVLGRRNARAILFTSVGRQYGHGDRLPPRYVVCAANGCRKSCFSSSWPSSSTRSRRSCGGETVPGGLALTVGRYTFAWERRQCSRFSEFRKSV